MLLRMADQAQPERRTTMTLSEKAAYLKGLMDGLDLDKESAEGKMIAGIVDLLGEMTTSISDRRTNARVDDKSRRPHFCVCRRHLRKNNRMHTASIGTARATLPAGSYLHS